VEDPGQSLAGELVRRAMGPYGPGGVSGLDSESSAAITLSGASDYTTHYSERRPHRALELKTPVLGPDPAPWPTEDTAVRTRERTRTAHP
jgi:hypothetical protein